MNGGGGERSTSNAQRSTLNEESVAVDGAGRQERYDLERRLLQFAGGILEIVDALPRTRGGNHVAGQLVRSGTSALPNHGEAQAAESRADFIHKMQICLKELRETRRWLRLILHAELLGVSDKPKLLVIECEELIRIFFKSVRTAATSAPEPSARIRETDSSDLSTLEVERWTLDVFHPPQE